MSIDSIVKLIGRPNIAGDLDDDKRQMIADEVLRRASEDKQSMKEWEECVNEGIKLCKPEFKGKDSPWTGAANYKATILTEAANTFGNRATIELMRDPNLVKTTIIGLKTIKNVVEKKASEIARWKADAERIAEGLQQIEAQMAESAQAGQPPAEDPEFAAAQKTLAELQAKIEENTQMIKAKKADIRNKNDRADRVGELMNWQVNHKMEEWRKDQKRLMYSLPNVGSMFKKTFYDATLGRCVSKVVNFPDFIVNQKTENLKTCRSFTHILAFSKAEADLRIKQGLWIDAELYPKDAEVDAGSNEASEGKETADNPEHFYEQYCWEDLDEDGIEEPYIATVHVHSAKLVRMVARYDEESIIVKREDIKPMPLTDAQKKVAQMIESENVEFLTNTPIPEPDDLTGYDVVRIEPIGIITKYGMIPSFDGTYLDVGYYHLIGSMTMGVNKTTNDLLNSGTLATQQGGIVAKNFRKKPGDFAWKMGQWIQTELSPDQLQSALMPMPYKEPSMGLFALNEKLENSARSFSANVDAGGQIQGNTAPTTALAMIQESLIQHTAHMSMIVDSMTEEFKILFELNKSYFDADDYKEIVGDDEAVFSEDFQTDGLSVVCGANPEMSSRMQRMMLAQAEMEQIPMVLQAGGNPVPIVKAYYKRIGSENLDEIFPNEAEMSPEEKAQMQQMQQQQEYANQLAEQQVNMITLQTELLKAEQDRKDREFDVKVKETLAKVDKLLEEVSNVRADTILKLEQAETEQVNNKINTYTARSDELTKAEQALLPAEDQE